MKIKQNKGFTLTELIVVIAIIGILAAVLIPSLTGYIKKARFNADVQDARNMNLILQSAATLDDIDVKKLDAPDIRYLINSYEKNYSFNPRSSDAIFLYNKEDNKIEVVKKSTLNIQAGTYDPSSVCEIFLNKIYLNTTGGLAEFLNTFRNIDSRNLYDTLINTIHNSSNDTYISDGFDITAIVKAFNPDNTLFINSQSSFSDASNEKMITKVVFSSNIKVIPSLVTQQLKQGSKFANTFTLVIPRSVALISNGAFTYFEGLTKVELLNKNVCIQESSFKSEVVSSNNLASNVMSYGDYLEKIAFGNELVTLNVTNNQSKVDTTELMKHFKNITSLDIQIVGGKIRVIAEDDTGIIVDKYLN